MNIIAHLESLFWENTSSVYVIGDFAIVDYVEEHLPLVRQPIDVVYNVYNEYEGPYAISINGTLDTDHLTDQIKPYYPELFI